ncbi:hypothetical protein QQF64_023492 [Cirrhinus molitorella]|uniref:MANSC domain-containing protein n=1 Tax=Cirrhinus molitorella TaxID=172907 RepID=A0ABR3L7N7_9TELE
MTVPWSLLWILALICSSDSSCSPTSYYKSCWIRRYPGLYVDIEESQRRGAHILKLYQEESALKCSRACCLTRNFSCNLAVFHFNTTQDSVNCFHLQCPTLDSCIPHHRGNVILYNVTKGVDPDLLVFGKYFTTNLRVLPHMSSSRLNISEPLTSDKRQFNYPPNPPIRSISPASTSTKKPTTPQKTTRAVSTAHEVQHNLPRCTTIQATTAQITSEHGEKMDSTLNPQQTTSTPQWASINLRHTTTTLTDEPDTTDTLNQSIPNPPPDYTTTAHPSSTTDYLDSTLTSVPINEALNSSITQQHLTLQTTTSLATASQDSMQSSGSSTTQQPSSLQTTNSLAATSQKSMQSSIFPTTQQSLKLKTSSLQTTNSSVATSQKSMQSSSSPTTQQPLKPETSALQTINPLPTASQKSMQSSSSSTIQQPLGLQTSTLQTTNSLAQKSTQSFTKVLTSTQQPSTQTTKQATSLSKSKLEEYAQTRAQTIVYETVATQIYASSQSETSMTTKPNIPLQALTEITTAYKSIQATTGPKMDSTLNPQEMTTTPHDSLTSAEIPLQTLTQDKAAYETSTWPSQTPTQATTLSQPKETTRIETTSIEISTSTPKITADGSTSFTRTKMGNSATTGSLSSSLTAPTSSVVDSQPFPNDTKGYISRNITTGDAPRPSEDESLTSVWHLAANTVLVALAACATITFCCCCSVFVALSWRGQRRRKGRYRTNLRCKRGSMRLIKYVIVRESS